MDEPEQPLDMVPTLTSFLAQVPVLPLGAPVNVVSCQHCGHPIRGSLVLMASPDGPRPGFVFDCVNPGCPSRQPRVIVPNGHRMLR